MTQAKKRPNVVLIMSDNHSADMLGCYGNPEIYTPNIDKLAGEGMRFNEAYCVNAMCSPCRASVLTGLMPTQHGIHTWIDGRDMDTWPANWNALANEQTLPELLKQAGYNTAMVGKYHLGNPFEPQNGFDHWVTFPHGHTRHFQGNTIIENGKQYIYEGHSVDCFAEKAVEYIDEADSAEPFFLFIPFNGPYGHWPSIQGKAQNRFAERYADCPMDTVPREGLSREAIEKYVLRAEKSRAGLDYSAVLRIPNDMDSLRNYYSQMSLVDDAVGQVAEALARNGVADDTIVIYTTDHGFSTGAHGFWGHGQATWPSNMHRAAYNIPLIVRQPGSVPAGTTTDATVSQLDIFATILELCDVAAPVTASRSLTGLLGGDSAEFPNTVIMEQEETRAIRTDRWLYMWRFNQHPDHQFIDELYDLESDPGERTNLASDVQHATRITELRRQITAYFEEWGSAEFDLWKGGTCKSNSDKGWYWEQVWGDDWAPIF